MQILASILFWHYKLGSSARLNCVSLTIHPAWTLCSLKYNYQKSLQLRLTKI